MSKSLHIWLKAGERLYINGAVLKADRKVSIELLNDAVFMREAHVLQAEETTTPLRQLYFVLQAVLMMPGQAETALALFDDLYVSTVSSFANPTVLAGLAEVEQHVRSDRVFDALKTLRGLYAEEESILEDGSSRAA